METRQRGLLGVSRREMEEYVTARLEALRLELQNSESDLQQLGSEPQNSESDLQKAYEQLSAKYEELLSSRSLPASRISDKAVDAFVQTLLANPATNMKLVPDRVERSIYGNVLKLVLHSLAHTSETAGIELLGHRIRLVIEPISVSAEGKTE